MSRRLVPVLVLALFTSLAVGLVRGYVLFVPGIFGMLAGGLVGYLSGRLGRDDEPWPPTARFGLTLGATLLYAVASAAVVAVVKAGAVGLPLEWLGDVVTGHGGAHELFFGTSRNSLQSVGGALSGGWWVVFVAVDAGLFAFVHLITVGVGLGASHAHVGDDESAPLPIGPGRPALASLGFAAHAAAAATVLALLYWWPSLPVPGGAPSTPVVTVGELQGEWVFEDAADVLGDAEGARRFSVSLGLGEELAGYSAEEGLYMIVMEPRRDGSFEGRFLIRDRGELPTRMRVSADLGTMSFTVRGVSRTGATVERELTARRLEAED